MSTAKIILSIMGKILLGLLFSFLITVALMAPAMAYLEANGYMTGGQPPLTSQPQIDSPFYVASMATQSLGFIGAAWLLYLWFERKKGWAIGWVQPRPFRLLGKGAWYGALLISVVFVVIWALGSIEVVQGQGQTDRTNWSALAVFLLLFLLASLNEEIFARGYVQGLVKHHYGRNSAIAVSALFFSMMHSFNPGVFASVMPMVNIFLAGVLFAVARESSGGLWLPIGLHWSWNFMQGNVFGFAVSGNRVESLLQQAPTGSVLLSGGAFGAEGSLVTTLVLAAGIYGLQKRQAKLAKS
jgi:membrane protease YdiL (CAAX protease family)